MPRTSLRQTWLHNQVHGLSATALSNPQMRSHRMNPQSRDPTPLRNSPTCAALTVPRTAHPPVKGQEGHPPQRKVQIPSCEFSGATQSAKSACLSDPHCDFISWLFDNSPSPPPAPHKQNSKIDTPIYPKEHHKARPFRRGVMGRRAGHNP